MFSYSGSIGFFAYRDSLKTFRDSCRTQDRNEEFVLDTLKKIHVPADMEDNIVTVYGYRTDVDYL